MKIRKIVVKGCDIFFANDFVLEIESRGIFVDHPETSSVYGYTSQGDRVEFLPGTRVLKIRDSASGIQLWLAPCEDIYISWEKIESGLGIFLDGFDEEKASYVASLCCSCIAKLAIIKGAEINIAFEDYD